MFDSDRKNRTLIIDNNIKIESVLIKATSLNIQD